MAQPGNTNALKHGASADGQIRTRAALHRRRVLRQFGLRSRDLSPVGRAHLDQVVRLRAKVEAIDEYVARHGLIREDGTAQPVLALYTTLENSLRLATTRLEEHLRQRSTHSPIAELQAAGRRARLAAVE